MGANRIGIPQAMTTEDAKPIDPLTALIAEVRQAACDIAEQAVRYPVVNPTLSERKYAALFERVADALDLEAAKAAMRRSPDLQDAKLIAEARQAAAIIQHRGDASFAASTITRVADRLEEVLAGGDGRVDGEDKIDEAMARVEQVADPAGQWVSMFVDGVELRYGDLRLLLFSRKRALKALATRDRQLAELADKLERVIRHDSATWDEQVALDTVRARQLAVMAEALRAVHAPYAALTDEALEAGILMEFGPPKPQKGAALLLVRRALSEEVG